MDMDEHMGVDSDSDNNTDSSTDNDGADLAGLVLALIGTRHSVPPKRLQPPGPVPDQLRQMVDAAACAPDHRGLRPWRLIRIADHQRDALADLFEACTRERAQAQGADLAADDVQRSRDKAYRAPMLLLAVLKAAPDDPEVPLVERAVTLGAALMNLLLAAHGLGFGAMLTSGRAVRAARFARAFALADDEQAMCFVSIGTAISARRHGRGSASDYLDDWQPGPGAGSGRSPTDA
jgi:nitroreductase